MKVKRRSKRKSILKIKNQLNITQLLLFSSARLWPIICITFFFFFTLFFSHRAHAPLIYYKTKTRSSMNYLNYAPIEQLYRTLPKKTKHVKINSIISLLLQLSSSVWCVTMWADQSFFSLISCRPSTATPSSLHHGPIQRSIPALRSLMAGSISTIRRSTDASKYSHWAFPVQTAWSWVHLRVVSMCARTLCKNEHIWMPNWSHD